MDKINFASQWFKKEQDIVTKVSSFLATEEIQKLQDQGYEIINVEVVHEPPSYLVFAKPIKKENHGSK